MVTVWMFCAVDEQRAEADRGRAQAEAEEAERDLAEDHLRDGEGEVDDEVAHEAGQEVAW